MKIYDAREGGGFLQIPPLPLCAAKDECHGPGTIPAPPPQIGTFKGKGGNVKPKKCKKPKVKRHGKCVKKPRRRSTRRRTRGSGAMAEPREDEQGDDHAHAYENRDRPRP